MSEIKVIGTFNDYSSNHKVADVSQIKDASSNNKSQKEINSELAASIDDIHDAEYVVNDRLGSLEEKVGEVSVNEQIGNAIDTLRTSINQSIENESSRAQSAESNLQSGIEALTQSAIVPITASDWASYAAETPPYNSLDPQVNTIYRVSGNSSYCDYVWDSENEAMVLMATYDNAFDDYPTKDSDNIPKSGGVYSKIKEVDDKFYYDLYTDVTGLLQKEAGKFIKSTGAIDSNAIFDLLYTTVTPGDRYIISATNTPSSSSARAWAFYNTSNPSSWSASTKVGDVGGAISRDDYSDNVTVPTGAVCMVVQNYNLARVHFTPNVKKVTSESVVEKIEQEIDDVKDDLLETGISKSLAYEYDGSNLYVAYLQNDGVEITYWFKKCMANLLYTFYKVGYRTVTREYPSTDGIYSGVGITSINVANGDNISPIVVSSSPSLIIGGNHTYTEDDVVYKTAGTTGYKVQVDGKTIGAGSKGYCERVVVAVSNNIYDPRGDKDTEEGILLDLFSVEDVMYTVSRNTIEVSCRQTFTADSAETYYGMQSMFVDETHIMTPLGEYTNWANGTVLSFLKRDYPNFNRFVEKHQGVNSASTYYQGSYLYPYKLGDHSMIENGTRIFIGRTTSNKSYHNVISNKSGLSGNSYAWSGAYTFFNTPIADNNDVFAYSGVVNGKDVVFINSKRPCNTNVQLPDYMLMRKISVIEGDGVVTTDDKFVDVEGVKIDAVGAGSLILTFGDVVEKDSNSTDQYTEVIHDADFGSNIVSGSYVGSGGNIVSGQPEGYKVMYIDCNKGDIFRIEQNATIATQAVQYAVYSTDVYADFSSSTAIEVGNVISGAGTFTVKVTSSNAASIAFTGSSTRIKVYKVEKVETKLFDKFYNKCFKPYANVEYNSDEVISEYDCIWDDGVTGHVTMTNYDGDVLEYAGATATYGSYTIVYNPCQFDEYGNVIKDNGFTIIEN